MGRKDPQTAVSKISSAAAPATTSTNPRKSSVLKSAFAPSQFQLHLFASVIQSFDSHQLRIHETTTGRLRSQHESKSKITCLDWGYYGAAYRERQQSKKKRKRDQDYNDGAVVAYGTNTSQICIFSPAEGRVVGTLTGGHERGLQDFKFSPVDYLQAWSIGEDAKLVQWDLTKDQPIRTINLPDSAVNLLALPSQLAPQILCASSTPFAIDITSSDDFRIDRFDSFKNSIHSLCRSTPLSSEESQYFIAADTDRYINIYSITEKKLVRTLVVGGGVTAVDLSTPSKDISDFLHQQMLCAVTKEGAVELFSNPFAESKAVNGNLKTSRKNLTRKASATVRLVSSESKNKNVPVVAAFLQGPDLIVVSADGGVDLAFQKVRWQDEGNGELLFAGVKEVMKVRSASTLNTATVNGVKDMGKKHVDESRTVVLNGGAGGPGVADAIEISSSESEVEDDDADSDNEASIKSEDKEEDPASEAADSDEEMADVTATAEEAETEETVQPSFGDLLASRHPVEIDISSALPTSSTALTPPKANALSITSGMSLGTVLTQALRTNDTPLLEACLHTLDLSIIRSTIQRIDSTLAGLLLSKLAERLASRPGRYGHLITWVQWTCIAHGGAIASMPDVNSKIRSLYHVLSERMRTLDDLLLLKGKLDLLDAQLQFRKSIAAQRSTAGKEGRDEPGVIYIEGDDNWDSDDDDLDEDGIRPSKRVKGTRERKDLDELEVGADSDDDEEDEDEDEDLPLANGANDLSSSDEDHDDSEDDGGLRLNGAHGALLDDEADVSAAEDSDSDPDDRGPSPLRSDSSSAASDSDDENDGEGQDDEEDSELDSFINDGSVDFEGHAADEIHVQGDESGVEKEAPTPVKKAGKGTKNKKGNTSVVGFRDEDALGDL